MSIEGQTKCMMTVLKYKRYLGSDEKVKRAGQALLSVTFSYPRPILLIFQDINRIFYMFTNRQR